MKNDNNKHTWCVNAEHGLSVGTTGTCKLCCMTQSDIKDENGNTYNVETHSLQEIFNSPELDRVRENLRNGIKDPGCKRCWEEEAAGRSSKRIRDNNNVNFQIPAKPGDLKILEMNLGNTCNIKCRTCGPHSSSQWVREWFDLVSKKEYPNLSWESFRKEKMHTQLYDSDSKFWNSVYTQTDLVEFMDFYGGEPFLINKQWEFIQYCVENNLAKDKTLHYNTNCTTWPEKYIDLLPNFKQLNMGLSIDGIGEHDHYIRYPTDWETVDSNVNRWYEYGLKNSNSSISVCMTLSPMNVFYIDDMLAYIKQKNVEFGSNVLTLYLNLIHYPKHYNISHMPQYLKDKVNEKLLHRREENPFLSGVLDFMNNGKYEDRVWKDFLDWIKMNDEYRNQNFAVTFPELNQIIRDNENDW